MSCCGGGGGGGCCGGNGAFPKRYEGGCNCSRGQRRTENNGGCCEPESTRYQSVGQRETMVQESTGGCGRPGCPRIVHKLPEPPEPEWEYTNYNRNNHRWPTAVVDNGCTSYGDDWIDGKKDYQSDYYEEFEMNENVDGKNCVYYERFGGGRDNFEENEENYLGYYYEKDPVDQQKPSAERVLETCRCSKCRAMNDSDDDDNQRRRRVHF